MGYESLTELQKLANEIKNEQQIGKNSAERIGNAFIKVGESIESCIETNSEELREEFIPKNKIGEPYGVAGLGWDGIIPTSQLGGRVIREILELENINDLSKLDSLIGPGIYLYTYTSDDDPITRQTGILLVTRTNDNDRRYPVYQERIEHFRRYRRTGRFDYDEIGYWDSDWEEITYLDTSAKGAANGIASLDENKEIPASQLGGFLIKDLGEISSLDSLDDTYTLESGIYRFRLRQGTMPPYSYINGFLFVTVSDVGSMVYQTRIIGISFARRETSLRVINWTPWKEVMLEGDFISSDEIGQTIAPLENGYIPSQYINGNFIGIIDIDSLLQLNGYTRPGCYIVRHHEDREKGYHDDFLMHIARSGIIQEYPVQTGEVYQILMHDGSPTFKRTGEYDKEGDLQWEEWKNIKIPSNTIVGDLSFADNKLFYTNYIGTTKSVEIPTAEIPADVHTGDMSYSNNQLTYTTYDGTTRRVTIPQASIPDAVHTGDITVTDIPASPEGNGAKRLTFNQHGGNQATVDIGHDTHHEIHYNFDAIDRLEKGVIFQEEPLDLFPFDVKVGINIPVGTYVSEGITKFTGRLSDFIGEELTNEMIQALLELFDAGITETLQKEMGSYILQSRNLLEEVLYHYMGESISEELLDDLEKDASWAALLCEMEGDIYDEISLKQAVRNVLSFYLFYVAVFNKTLIEENIELLLEYAEESFTRGSLEKQELIELGNFLLGLVSEVHAWVKELTVNKKPVCLVRSHVWNADTDRYVLAEKDYLKLQTTSEVSASHDDAIEGERMDVNRMSFNFIYSLDGIHVYEFAVSTSHVGPSTIAPVISTHITGKKTTLGIDVSGGNYLTGEGISMIKRLTQAAYDALPVKDINTLYVIIG